MHCHATVAILIRTLILLPRELWAPLPGRAEFQVLVCCGCGEPSLTCGGLIYILVKRRVWIAIDV